MMMNRQRVVGLANGSVWLISVSAVFATVSLILIRTRAADWALGGMLAVLAVLLGLGGWMIRAAQALPRDSAPRTAADRALARRFAMVVGAEVLAFAVVNPIAAGAGYVTALPSLNLIIVGLHFLPLAWLFRVPRYYVMGGLFCLIPIVTLLAIPGDAVLGHAIGWYVVPSLACSVVASATGAAGLREAWQSARQIATR